MADVVERAGRLRRELQGAARAAGQIGVGGKPGASDAGMAAELGKLRRELQQGGRLEWRRQNL